MALNDAELRFQASLEDDASPQIDALVKKLQAAGASPTEIKMYLRAQDEATPHIHRVRKMMDDLPKDHTINLRVASDHARAHLRGIRDEFTEPIAVPLKFTDNLEEIGQKLFTFKSRYAVPMAGMVPGANMLYGVGMGAGILGAAGGASELLKKSVDVNAELQQQNASLTQALKDNTAATQEMGRIMGMAGKSQFSRGDLTQADIISRQFNLPSFAGESKYMPQGVIPQAQNLAAVGQTSVSQAAQAIAGATQGYFRQLMPYGISIRQEDFSPGGRFAGKSYQEAIDQATKRFSGAAETQAKTFTGMLERFHNMFEDKILQPLGAFTFDQIGHQLQTMLGGGTQEGFQDRISNFVNKAQEGLTKLWDTLQKGKDYFDVNIRAPLSNIVSDIVKVGTVFAKFFTGTMVGVLKTLGEAILAIARPVANLVTSVPQLAEFFGVMKALSLLGFKDISGPFVNPLKDLAGLHFGALLRDLSGIPGALTKIGVALIVKGFVDAHVATKALNDQFPTMADHMDDVNAKITQMSYGLHESATHMKELVAAAANGLPTSLGDKRRLELSIDVGRAGAQLHQQTGMPEMQAVRMITAEMRRSGEYSDKKIRDFGSDLDQASAAAKELGFSFSDLQRIVTQYAGVANPIGMGGPGGAGALMGLQSGVNKITMSKDQRELYPTRDMFMSALLKNYGQPSAQDVSTLMRHGQLSETYNFRMPTRGQLHAFNTGQDTLLQQYHTAVRSDRQAQAIINRAAPDVNVPQTPMPGIRQFLGVTPQQYRNVRRDERTGNANALGTDLAAGRETNLKIFDAINSKTQELQKNIGELTNKVSDYQQAQERLNLDIGAFQHMLQGKQRVIEDLSLSLQKYTFDTLHPLERQMTRLNEVMAENQNVMSDAQYEQGKWAESLFVGEQKALDQLHALENYNKQLQLLQLIYQQIGGDLGTTIYDQGAQIKIAPMSNIGLAMAEQVTQRRQQIAQTKYDLNYGEKHYQVGQAQRTEFQRTERDFGAVLSHVKSSQGVIDTATRQAHELGQEQFAIQKHMFHVNEHIQDQQDNITGLNLALQSLQQGKKMREWQDDEYHLGRQMSITNRRIARREQLMSALKNIIDNTNQGKTNFGKLFQETLDFSVGNSFSRMHKAIREAYDTGMLGEGGPARKQFNLLNAEVDRAQKAARQAQKEHWYQDRTKFKDVLVDALKTAGGIWTGSTERNAISIVQRHLRHVPVVGPAIGNSTAGEIAAIGATAYMGVSTLGAARTLARTGIMRGGAHLLSHIPGLDTHLFPRVGRVAEGFAGWRHERAVGRLGRLRDHYGDHPSWLQRRRITRAADVVQDSERAVEIARGLQSGESDIVSAAQFATRHPLERAAGRFRWIRRTRERIGAGLGGAGGGFAGGLVAGEPGAVVGSWYGERKGGMYAEERSTREIGHDAIGAARKTAKKLEDIHAFLVQHKPLRTPEELDAYSRESLQNLKDARHFLKDQSDAVKRAEGGLEGARSNLQAAILDPRSTPQQIEAAKSQVEAAHSNVNAAKESEKAAKHMRDRAVEFRQSAEKMIHSANEHVRGGKEQISAGRKQASNISEDHKSRVRTAASEHAAAHSMGSHVERFKVHMHEFGKKVAIFGVAVAAFDGIKDAIGRFFHHDPKVPGGRGPKTVPHPEVAKGPLEYDPSSGRVLGAGDHVAARALSHPIRSRLKGVFAHGQRGAFGGMGAESLLGGDPLQEGFTGAALGEEALKTARMIKAHGGVKSAAAKRVLERYGEKYASNPLAKKALVRAGTSIGIDILAGGTPVVGWAYDLYSANELAKHVIPQSGAETIQQDTQRAALGALGHAVLPSGIKANRQAEAAFSAQRLKGAPGEVLDYLKQHQTTLAEMEKIYAQGGKLPKLFDDYFSKQLFLTRDQARADLKILTDHQSDVIDKTTQHFKDRVTAHQTGLTNVNDTEDKGFKVIYGTVDEWLSRVANRVKRTKRDLGLTHDTGGSTGDVGQTTSNAYAGGGHAAGGVVSAATEHLARNGGRIIKVGEEGPEMIVPLMPHRRERAKQLIKQAHTIVGMANGGFTGPHGSLAGMTPLANFAKQKFGLWVSAGRTDHDALTAAGRPSDHAWGGAIDLQNKAGDGNLKSSETPEEWAFMRFMKNKAPQIIKQMIFDNKIQAGGGLGGFVSGHMNHVHVALLQQYANDAERTAKILADASKGTDFTSLLVAGGQDVGATTAGVKLPRTPKGLLKGGPVGNMLYHWMAALRNRWQKRLGATSSATGTIDGSAFHGGGNAQANMRLGKQMAGTMGWTGGNWDALKNLWIGESGWDQNAYNKASGATGIPQSLPGNKMASAGSDWKTNPATQIAWGLNYIKSAYGSPSNAYSKWLSRSPHWYHKGSWNVGNDDHPAMLQKGEMVLPRAVAAAVRSAVPKAIGGHAQPTSGDGDGTRTLVRHINNLEEAIKKVEKQLKNLNDKTDKQNTRDHLSQLNSELRISRNQLSARHSAAEASTIKGLLKGDPSDGEGTQALVDHERKIMRGRGAAAIPMRQVTRHVSNLSKTAHSLLHTAHTKAQKVAAKHAVHSTNIAEHAVKKMNSFASHHHKAVTELAKHDRQRRTAGYIVGAAKRGTVDAHLIRSITGHALTAKQARDYKKVAQDPTAKHIAALRKDFVKGMSKNAEHLAKLRAAATRDAARAQKSVQHAAALQHKSITAAGKLQVRAADRSDQRRAKAEAAADKRDRDHQKKVLTLLENIANRDLSVNIHNEAHGAALKTSTTRTRRRKR